MLKAKTLGAIGMQSFGTSKPTPSCEARIELAKRLHAAIESKKRWFPRMVALLGNEIRLCEYRTDVNRWNARVRFTYKIFGPDEMEKAIAWVEALES